MLKTIDLVKTSSRELLFYDSVDVTTGKAMVTFYAVGGYNDATEENFLTTNTLWGNPVLCAAAAGTTDANVIEKNFDVSVEKPFIIEGTAIVNVPYYIVNDFANARTMTVIVKLMSVEGTKETIIGQVEMIDDGNAAAGPWASMKCSQFTCTRTKLKRGNKLRLSVEGWRKDGGGPDDYDIGFAYDPKNAAIFAGDTTPSVLSVQIPVVVNV